MRGFSLIETMIALGLTAIMLPGILYLFTLSSRYTEHLDKQQTALSLASDYLELRPLNKQSTLTNNAFIIQEQLTPLTNGYHVSVNVLWNDRLEHQNKISLGRDFYYGVSR